MEVIHSIFVPLFNSYYSTGFSTVKPRVLKLCEQSLHILLTRISAHRFAEGPGVFEASTHCKERRANDSWDQVF